MQTLEPIKGNANIGFWQIFGQEIKIRLLTVAVCSVGNGTVPEFTILHTASY